MGGVYGEQKDKYFSHADAFVHPTMNDCFPLVILEAMQHSLPIISTLEGGIPNIVDDKVGFLVERGNSQALADKMQYLLQNIEIGKEIGNHGRLKYEREYTLPVFEKRLVGILSEVLRKL